MAKRSSKPRPKPSKSVKLDLGCGKNKREGFLGVDVEAFEGVDLVLDLRVVPWPWADGSVEEVNCSHFLEHLTAEERIVFFNELYRVMAPEAKAVIVTPHWASGRAYGDLTHKWPPIVEFFWYYLSGAWREVNAPHVPLECNFEVTWGYSVAPIWQARNAEAQAFGLNHYREVAQDMIATATKKPHATKV